MSLAFQPAVPQSKVSLPINNGAHVSQLASSRNCTKQAHAPAESYGASPRFNSPTMDELSEELDRRTKETQRLQEEVENATKITFERVCYLYGIHSPAGQSCHRFNVNDSPGDSSIHSMHQLASLNQEGSSSPEKEFLGNDCLQQLPDLHLNKTHDQPEEEAVSFNKIIMSLQAKLHKVQKEKAVLSDLRLKDSRTHVGQMENMLFMLEELQKIKRAEDQKLQETEEKTLSFKRKVETLEPNVNGMYKTLSHETQCGDNITSPYIATTSRHLSKDFGYEMDELQERLFSQSIKHLGSEESSGVNEQNGRMEELIASLGQEMALLTEKLSSSKNSSFNLSLKLGLIKKLAERQTLVHQCQVRELESTLCSHKDKVCCLEQQLIEAQSQLVDAQRERTRSLQQAEELQSQLGQFKHLARLEEAQSRCQTLHAEGQTVRLKPDHDRESCIQMHNRTIDDLQQENSLLGNQLNQHTLEIQQLRAKLDQHKSDVAAAELKSRQLLVSVAEQSQRVQEETLEKQQLTIQLEVQRLQILTLTKKHKELQQLHSCKNEEHKGVELKLQSRLRNALDELDQVRSTLRTLEGADGQGLRAAVDMQQEVTARREQVDSLQGKVQHLEEIVDKLYQEKRYRSLENQHQLQELTFIREEKRQLGNELEALRSTDKQLRERISQMEGILHKMSESFADCQDFIQLQEQGFFRLKLQHALNLKEFRGQTFHTALNVPPPDPDSWSPSALTAPPSSQHASNTQTTDCHAREPRSPVRELRGVNSGKHRPHTDNRRRSAPERVHRTTFIDKAEEIKAGSRLRRKTCGSEAHFLKAVELNGKITSNKFSSETTAASYTTSLQLLSLGRRSPVHSLLTSDPNNSQ